MNAMPFERFLERLWPSGEDDKTFALLDCARDERVHATLTHAGLHHRCLYIGEVAPVLARAAPWLVQLQRDAPFTRELYASGWGHAWGVYARSEASFDELHRHFRGLLRVADASGQTRLFRYYDPRVLRVYLPTCDEARLGEMFGPVERYVVEGATAERVSIFRRPHGALVCEDARYEQRLHWLKDYLRKT